MNNSEFDTHVCETHNHHYRLFMQDYTRYRDYLLKHKPEREIGIKWSNWTRAMDRYERYYRENPYWVQAEIFSDDGVVQREFSDRDEAEQMYNELATCSNVPDFWKLGFD